MITNYFKVSNVDFDKSTIIKNANEIYINAYFIPEEYSCPNCQSYNLYKNGHCKKTVKHCVYYSKLIIVKCNFQIYKCKECGNIFQEHNYFSPPFISLSYESIFAIFEKLKKPNESFESIAKDLHISRQNTIDIFDRFYDYTPSLNLPEIISFDEKHIGRIITDHKYLFIMLDWKNNKLYDILPSRDKNTLWKYFSKIPREIRTKVKYVTMDMWEPYRDVTKALLPSAKIAVDSFHVMKNINTAMNKIRCIVMQKYNQKTEKLEDNNIYYYLLKKFDYFFTKELDDISSYVSVPKLKTKMSKYNLLKELLNIDPRIEEAYRLTSKYREFNRTAKYENCTKEIEELITDFLNSSIEAFNTIGRMLLNWKDEIINSFTIIDYNDNKRRLSNGPIEGINSIIEQIKINGKGYTNYDRLKRRIIYTINKDTELKNIPKKLLRNK